MRVLIACDKFKGSMTGREACEAVARGLGNAWEIDLCPIADGGEGFTEALVTAGHGTWVEMETVDALGHPIKARYGLLEHGGVRSAVIEMAAASGILLIPAMQRNIRRASTYGTGLMMRHAVEISGAERLLIGIGGSATNDGGVGMAAALGVQFRDDEEEILDPCPEDFVRLTTIDISERIALPEVIVACDVDNPLCGERGASAVFGPQKGANVDDVVFLDEVLANVARLSGGAAHAMVPGAGAAGGLGFGLLHFAGGKLVAGFDLVAEALELEERIAQADWVITGEGSLDVQSLGGKGPVGVARMAQSHSVPVLAVAGRIDPHVRESGLFAQVIELSATVPVEEAIMRGPQLVGELVHQWTEKIG